MSPADVLWILFRRIFGKDTGLIQSIYLNFGKQRQIPSYKTVNFSDKFAVLSFQVTIELLLVMSHLICSGLTR